MNIVERNKIYELIEDFEYEGKLYCVGARFKVKMIRLSTYHDFVRIYFDKVNNKFTPLSEELIGSTVETPSEDFNKIEFMEI